MGQAMPMIPISNVPLKVTEMFRMRVRVRNMKPRLKKTAMTASASRKALKRYNRFGPPDQP